MEQETNTIQEKILEQLKLLNEQTKNNNSIKNIFYTGLIYGLGFFIGSAILATIALGFFGPWFAEIDWVRENFERGTSLKQATSVQSLPL